MCVIMDRGADYSTKLCKCTCNKSKQYVTMVVVKELEHYINNI